MVLSEVNKIFLENIECISLYNKKLASGLNDIKKLTCDLCLVYNDTNTPNLLLDGQLLHNNIDPEKEALDIINTVKNDSVDSIYFVFGIGLGYLFKEVFARLKGKIILFEPNKEVLKSVFEIVDFKNELSSSRVRVICDADDILNNILYFYNYSAKVVFLFLDSYKKYYPEKYKELFYKISKDVSIIEHNYKFTNDYISCFFNQTLQKLDKKIELPDIYRLENKFKNKPAIIVSAGPTLYENIDRLKQYQNNAIIFCVGTAFKVLKENNIKVDFLNIIEFNDCTEQLRTYDTSNINFISEPSTHYKFFEREFRRHFLTFSQENLANNWYMNITEQTDKFFEAKGTVSYHALYSAKVLGCNPIILLGQDLAYTHNQLYSENSVYSEFKCVKDPDTQKFKVIINDYEKLYKAISEDKNHCTEKEKRDYLNWKLNHLNSSLVTIKGQNGELIPSQNVYLLFLDHFKEFAEKNNKEIKLINSSIGGAFIDGFDHIPLDIAMKPYGNNIIDVENQVLKDLDLSSTVNKEKFYKNLKADLELLKKILSEYIESKKYFEIYKKEINRAKYFNDKAIINLRKFVKIYKEIIEKNSKDLIILLSILKPTNKLNKMIRNMSDKTDYKSHKEMILKIEEFFIEIESTFGSYIEIINKYF